MAEPTQAGAAAACPGPPCRCPHSGTYLGPLAPLGPHRDSAPSSRVFCGLPVGLGERQELERLGKKERALLCCPCHASPAASSRVRSLPTLQTEISPNSWLSSATAASPGGVEQWGTGCRAQIGAVPSCIAGAEAFWAVQPLGVVAGSNVAAAAPSPVPWWCLLSPWPCWGRAAVVLVPGWQALGPGELQGCGRADWQHRGEGAAWEPWRGPRAAAASPG